MYHIVFRFTTNSIIIIVVFVLFFLKDTYNNDHDSKSVHEIQKESAVIPAAPSLYDSEDCKSAGASSYSPEAELNELQIESSDSERETLSRVECEDLTDLVVINSDPSSWPAALCNRERDVTILKGPLPHSLKQPDYPRDSRNRIFPLNVFHQSLPNKETVERDFLVWSSTTKALYCFSCSLMGSEEEFKSLESSLLRWNGGARDQWRKLIDRVNQHQSSLLHQKFYINWKEAFIRLTSSTGIDSELQNRINSEAAKWRIILRGIWM